MTKATAARRFRGTPENLRFLARQLQAGELVAVPTETVYGLAANALDEQACRRIFLAKGRPLHDPLIVHVHSLRQLPQLCRLNSAARKLARAFWPGPLTLVLPKQPGIASIITAGRPSIAVRIPRHPLFRRLLRAAALPLAAPSANPFGYVSPTSAAHVKENLGRRIRYILDGGPSVIGLESTIVDLRVPARPRVLRPGAISAEDIARVLRCKVTRASRKLDGKTRAQIAPGLLARHYSPATPVQLHDAITDPSSADECYIFLRRPPGPRRPNILWLDAKGDLRGVARNLFATLRRADRGGFRRIHVERATGDGLAVAINDRLNRAAAR